MFRILKFVLSVCLLGVVVFFGGTVKLGERTLFEHVAAIGKSDQSKALMEAKEKLGDVGRKVKTSMAKAVRDATKDALDVDSLDDVADEGVSRYSHLGTPQKDHLKSRP